MTTPLVVVDADVLGRQRTGDETYVENLLRELGRLEHGLRIAAVTRHPERVPEGIEPLPLPATSQIERMSWSLPRLLRHVRPALAHFQYVIPPGYRRPSVVTVHDISFERERVFMNARDRLIFRTLVPRSIRRADRVLTVSEFTKRELADAYSVSDEKVVVTPNGVDPVFQPAGPARDGRPYALFVGALQPRKNPELALMAVAAAEPDLRLVVAGPEKRGGDDLRMWASRLGLEVEFLAHVEKEELAALYRGAACLVFPSRYEGFGLPVLEAMACGTPVVASSIDAVREVAGDAAVLVDPDDPKALARGIARAVSDGDRLARLGPERAKRFTWEAAARRTLAVYEELAT